MRPYSRGTPPIEFSLRVSCEVGPQFSLGNNATPHEFQLHDINCRATDESGRLLVTATGFSSLTKATEFFYELQNYMARISVSERIAISIPSHLAEPVQAAFSFMAEDTRCLSHGWPQESIRPWLIPTLGASVYPEHEYVAIDEVYGGFVRFSYSLGSFVDRLRASCADRPPRQPVDEVLLLAIAGYSQAKRSTQWVWSFLLTVMTLEMLATQTPSSDETIGAIKALLKHAKSIYGEMPLVDLELMRSCLSSAKRISKKSAVRALVRLHCAPGVSLAPLGHLFADAADCDRKIRAIYDMRSMYVHEGRVSLPTTLKYTFDELRNIAMDSLGHILLSLLPAR